MLPEERELWLKLKEDYLNFKIDGILYRMVINDSKDDFTTEPFDAGERGYSANLLGLDIDWEYVGKHRAKRLRNSRKRRMTRMVESRLRRLKRKYGGINE